MVNLRINETLQFVAVKKPRLPRRMKVHIFFGVHNNLGHSCDIEEQFTPIQRLYRPVVAVDNRFKCRNLRFGHLSGRS